MSGNDHGELIDWHTNLWLPEHFSAEHNEEMASQLGPATDGSPTAHQAGVVAVSAKFVVLALRWNRLGTHIPNEYVADYVKQYPGRAVGFACVDPHDADAPEELERAITELGMRGLKMSPVYAGFDPWAPEGVAALRDRQPAWHSYSVAPIGRLSRPIGIGVRQPDPARQDRPGLSRSAHDYCPCRTTLDR